MYCSNKEALLNVLTALSLANQAYLRVHQEQSLVFPQSSTLGIDSGW